MSTQEMLLAEIRNRPEQREEEAWADVLPARQVEQEVLDILDSHDSAPR